MPSTQVHEEFVQFMQEYTAFLVRMCADEKGKMQALQSKELPKIERSIAASQANAKQLQNLEERRIELQKTAGYEGLTFRQLVERVTPERQGELWGIFSEFEKNVADIKFYNDKSMSIARDNMIDISPEAALSGSAVGTKPKNPYEKIREENTQQSSILQTKA